LRAGTGSESDPHSHIRRVIIWAMEAALEELRS
jgi:hypothetical protein